MKKALTYLPEHIVYPLGVNHITVSGFCQLLSSRRKGFSSYGLRMFYSTQPHTAQLSGGYSIMYGVQPFAIPGIGSCILLPFIFSYLVRMLTKGLDKCLVSVVL